MKKKDKAIPFVMPDWMEDYRDLIANTGGNSIEDLMTPDGTNFHNNFVRAALQVACDSQITLLRRMHLQGMLVRPAPKVDKGKYK